MRYYRNSYILPSFLHQWNASVATETEGAAVATEENILVAEDITRNYMQNYRLPNGQFVKYHIGANDDIDIVFHHRR